MALKRVWPSTFLHTWIKDRYPITCNKMLPHISNKNQDAVCPTISVFSSWIQQYICKLFWIASTLLLPLDRRNWRMGALTPRRNISEDAFLLIIFCTLQVHNSHIYIFAVCCGFQVTAHIFCWGREVTKHILHPKSYIMLHRHILHSWDRELAFVCISLCLVVCYLFIYQAFVIYTNNSWQTYPTYSIVVLVSQPCEVG